MNRRRFLQTLGLTAGVAAVTSTPLVQNLFERPSPTKGILRLYSGTVGKGRCIGEWSFDQIPAICRAPGESDKDYRVRVLWSMYGGGNG